MAGLTITITLTSILAIWFAILSWRVVQARGSQSVSLGDGGDELLLRRMRGHGNFSEYVPIILLLFLLAELQAGSNLFVLAMAVVFALGRLLHGIAFSFTNHFVAGRVGGTAITLLTLIIMALANLFMLLT